MANGIGELVTAELLGARRDFAALDATELATGVRNVGAREGIASRLEAALKIIAGLAAPYRRADEIAAAVAAAAPKSAAECDAMIATLRGRG